MFFFKLTAYSAHSRPPWVHSYTRPRVSRTRTADAQEKVITGEAS